MIGWRYVLLTGSTGCGLDPFDLFDAMSSDLLADGNVEKALEKAFRWGYESEDGDKVDGLKDIMDRLRNEREDLQDDLAKAERSGVEDAPEGASADQPTADTDDDPSNDEPLSGEQRLQQIQQFERSLKQLESLDDLANLQTELIDSLMSDQERDWIEQWKQMKGRLKEAGLIVEGDRALELTPLAIQRIGAHLLRTMFVPGREHTPGDHEHLRTGTRGVPADTSSAWEFGQPFDLHLARTIMNAVQRSGGASPLRLTPDDFEIHDRESSSATATVLLIDMSRSMFHNGCWDAAKRSALALDSLIRTKYPRDELAIAGFSGTAQELSLEQLPSLTWDAFSHGTNLQSGFALAGRLLNHHRRMNRQVIVITDGEPNAFDNHGEVLFENPVTRLTLDATLTEVMRLTRENVGITTFLLDRTDALESFVQEMTRINRGRVIQADPDSLGRYLVRDFASGKSAVVG